MCTQGRRRGWGESLIHRKKTVRRDIHVGIPIYDRLGLLTIYLATRALLQAGEHTQQPALEPRRVLGGAGGLVDL